MEHVSRFENSRNTYIKRKGRPKRKHDKQMCKSIYNMLNLHESKCIIYRHVFSTYQPPFCTTGTQWSPRSRRAQISPFFMWRSLSMSSKSAPGNWSKLRVFWKHPEMHRLNHEFFTIYIYISWHIYHRDLVKMNIICRKPVTMGLALKGKFTCYLLVAPRLIHVFLVCFFATRNTIW